MYTLDKNSKLLRIFIGDSDLLHHKPLYEAILLKAKESGLAGGTVLRGIMSYGASSRIHTVKLLDISADLPIIIEIIDHDEKIRRFTETVSAMIEEVGCGGLITVEAAEVIYYKSKKIKA